MSFLVSFNDLSADDRIKVQGIKPDKKNPFRISN